MPFIVYERKNGYLERVKKVSLAGYGPIHSLAESRFLNASVKNNNEGIGWEIAEEDLIEELGFDAEKFRLVIDLKPNVKQNVSLYYLRRILGYSYDTWTPVALQLETIFVDKEVENPAEFKQKFREPSEDGDIVHEFLYLQGGREEGNWVWGRVGNVNGCLLWPSALRFFVDKIAPYIKQK